MPSVIVCCPFYPEKKLCEQFSSDTTVIQLKHHLANAYVNDRSVIDSMRLIYAGKMLKNDLATLEEIIKAFPHDTVMVNDDVVMTIHMVYKQTPSQNPTASSEKPKKETVTSAMVQTSSYIVLLHGRPYLLQIPSSSSTFMPHQQHGLVPPSPLHPLMSPLATTHGFVLPNNNSAQGWPLGIGPFIHLGNHQNTQSTTELQRHPVVETQQPAQEPPTVMPPQPQQQPIAAAPVANAQPQNHAPQAAAPQNPGNFVFNAGQAGGGGLALAAGAQDVDDEGRAINHPPNPFMLLLKLSFLLYLFTQKASYERAAILVLSAFAIFMIQMGYAQMVYTVLKRTWTRPSQPRQEENTQQQESTFVRSFINVLLCFVTSMFPTAEQIAAA